MVHHLNIALRNSEIFILYQKYLDFNLKMHYALQIDNSLPYPSMNIRTHSCCRHPTTLPLP